MYKVKKRMVRSAGRMEQGWGWGAKRTRKRLKRISVCNVGHHNNKHPFRVYDLKTRRLV